MTRIAFIVLNLFFASACLAEESRFAVYGFLEKHDSIVRLLEKKENIRLQLGDIEEGRIQYSTHNQVLAGAGMRFDALKLEFAQPRPLEDRTGIKESRGQYGRLSYFNDHFFMQVHSLQIEGYYLLSPDQFDEDGTRVYPSRNDMAIKSNSFRLSYNFEPSNYSYRAKHAQVDVMTEHDGATFLLDLRFKKDSLTTNGQTFIPQELINEFSDESLINGLEANQINVLAGLGYMTRENALYATLDAYGGLSYQDIDIKRTTSDKEEVTTSLTYAAEFTLGLVLNNFYIAGLINLEASQIPLGDTYLELGSSFIRLESGLRF